MLVESVSWPVCLSGETSCLKWRLDTRSAEGQTPLVSRSHKLQILQRRSQEKAGKQEASAVHFCIQRVNQNPIKISIVHSFHVFRSLVQAHPRRRPFGALFFQRRRRQGNEQVAQPDTPHERIKGC